MMFKFVAALKL